jgi:hypothetical protein
MFVAPTYAWKLALALALVGAILASVYARPPSRSFPGAELRRLVLAALALYAVGLAASLTHHAVLAVILYAAGIIVSTLAAWLSRGTDSGDWPRRGDEPDEEQPPPAPDGAPSFDWAAFERELEAWAQRDREPAATR